MNMTEMIRGRRSVRTFDGTPLREEDAGRILEFAGKVENPYELPIQWKLLDRKSDKLSVPVIEGTDTYIAGKMRREAHAEEAFGYSFEKVVLFAGSLGVGTTWIAGTMDRKAFERAMHLSENEVMPCVSPLGYTAKKMSLRETMMLDKPLAAENAGNLQLALEMVRLAPSAVNGQPWRAVRCGDCVHFYEKRGRGMASDTWDIQKIDMGIALCHFELGAIESGLHPVMDVADPGIPGQDGLIYIASFRIG